MDNADNPRTARSNFFLWLTLFILGAWLILWPGLLSQLFVSDGFMPHGGCYLWTPWLVRLHVLSDLLIGLSYVAISLTLTYLVKKARQDIPFSWMFLAFGAFIISCGGTHFMELWNVWHAHYWLAGAVKLVTAITSVATAILLPGLIPDALELGRSSRLANERKAELEVLNQKLVELDKVKTQFFANVSHELRTPLALILGPLEKLLAEEARPAQHEALQTAQRNAQTLLGHVEELLDVAKLEAGRMTVDYARTDLAKLVRLVASHFDVLAAEKKIAYSVETPQTLTTEVDPKKLQQVILNLLSNAFKFAPDGEKVLCVLRGEKDRAIIEVHDSGPGIPPNMREAVFERFRQLEGGSTRRFGGTGLGLAIVKDFVELHGGSIRATGSPLGGALFSLELPLKAPPGLSVHPETENVSTDLNQAAKAVLDQLKNHAATEAAIAGPVAGKPLALIVEDSPDMSHFVAQLLAPDFNVITAADGKEGLEKALAHLPDIIVSDVMMPVLSGDQLVHELRQRPELAGIPILLLTAKADDELRVRMLREGASDYVVKPFLGDELLARVVNLFRSKKNRQELETKNTELAAVNRELDAFSYSASHDLRAPLRHVSSYLSLIKRDIGKDLNDRDSQYFDRVEKALERMDNLIDSLLRLGYVNRQELKIEKLDLSQTVQELSEDLKRAEPARIAQFNIIPNAIVQGDQTLLRTAMANLLDNAWKFTRSRPMAYIEFGYSEKMHTYFIRDNGVGFDAKYTNKVFEPFRRLHSASDYPGVGVGLAVVQRIIERHRGKLWVEASKDKGATFYFTLP